MTTLSSTAAPSARLDPSFFRSTVLWTSPGSSVSSRSGQRSPAPHESGDAREARAGRLTRTPASTIIERMFDTGRLGSGSLSGARDDLGETKLDGARKDWLNE